MPGPEIAELQGLLNQLRNAGFEEWVGGSLPYWTLEGAGAIVTADAADFFIGTRAVKLTRAGADATLAQNVVGQATGLTYVRGKTFTLSTRVKPDAGVKAVIGIDDGQSQVWSGYPTDATAYATLVLTKLIDLAATKLHIVCKVKDAPGSAHFDACMLTEGHATPAFAPNPLDAIDPQNSDRTAPATQVGLAAAGGPLTITLTWDANSESDVVGYDIQRASDAGFTANLLDWRVDSTKYTDIPGVTATRYYRIRAVRRSGAVSAWTNGVSGAATDVQPAGLYAVVTHDHAGPADAQVPEDGLVLSDVVSGDASVTRHGFLPKLPNDAGKVFLGSGIWGNLPALGASSGYARTFLLMGA